ncbi:EPIDERMAL PATTERNING FACTOR-like protein 6 [Musa acuminata AAA Group]|uniref:EPIDERMAL PATTERNING FACTOR-like protein 6 n=1 Tax=Musa acuminata AAA Group TaxID=214697 RepID=UPI0031D41EEC
MDLRRDGSASKMALLLCCALVCLLSFRALLTSPHSDAGSPSSASHAQEAWAGGRRELRGGPGSYPPLCTAKCGDCTPCVPVHVAVPPGRPVIAEYYPEAWRCKCRNKLYMP